MVDLRKIPTRIMVVDRVGVAAKVQKHYLKLAEGELRKIEGQVERGKLSQGVRKVDFGQNVAVECCVMFNFTTATVTIGAHGKEKVKVDPCYCCSPCLAAAVIMDVKTSKDDGSPDFEKYVEEINYYADIMLCQASNNDEPKKITVFEEISSGVETAYREKVIQNHGVSNGVVENVIFSDYQNHEVGDVVMVLVQPLYEFIPAPYGEYSPCVNYRKVDQETVENPAITCTTEFTESSGMSCKILQDKAMWDETEDPPGDLKYFPFRILPIKIESCF